MKLEARLRAFAAYARQRSFSTAATELRISQPAISKHIAELEHATATAAPRPPSGDNWIHEIKQDGYRLMARRDAGGARLLTRNGHTWTERYPSIASAVGMLA
jgi:ATP-dependent DNA ligase